MTLIEFSLVAVYLCPTRLADRRTLSLLFASTVLMISSHCYFLCKRGNILCQYFVCSLSQQPRWEHRGKTTEAESICKFPDQDLRRLQLSLRWESTRTYAMIERIVWSGEKVDGSIDCRPRTWASHTVPIGIEERVHICSENSMFRRIRPPLCSPLPLFFCQIEQQQKINGKYMAEESMFFRCHRLCYTHLNRKNTRRRQSIFID